LHIVDIQHLRVAVKARDRAGGYAVGEAASLAFVGHDMGH
jgi:hypothetical protein